MPIHPVLRVLAERKRAASLPGARRDGHSVALAIEGGGNRGAYAGGMGLELYERGLLGSVDAVYGASAGALVGAWLLSSRPSWGLSAWSQPGITGRYVSARNLLRRRPLVDLRELVEVLYARELGLDAEAILANPIQLHPLATDAVSGRSTDLHPWLTGPQRVRDAMRASASIPVLAGPAVEVAGGRYLDAGVAESVPYRTALQQGASHVLVLRSKRPGEPGDAPAARAVATSWLRRYSSQAADAFAGRRARAVEDERILRDYNDNPDAAQQAVLSVRPQQHAPRVGRLDGDPTRIREAMHQGRAAMAELLEPAMHSLA